MGIRFIFGRAGSGKSHYCLNQIKKKLDNDKNNKLILLVPDQYTFQTEKKLLEYIGERALLRAEVLSFKRMATRVFDKCGGRAINIITLLVIIIFFNLILMFFIELIIVIFLHTIKYHK